MAAASPRITIRVGPDDFDVGAETPQAAAATAATMGKAKLLGLDKQIIDLKSSDGSMTPKGAINIGELSDSAMAEILKARDAADS